jgi:hypothetical protein
MPGVAQEAPDCFAVDTDSRITAALARAVAATELTVGGVVGKPRGIGRYVSLHEPESVSDLTPEEMQVVWDEGLALWVFQHVLYPGWTASAQLGADLGGKARENARAIGYAPGCHVFVDVEGTSSVGEPVAEFVNAWAAEMAEGFPPGFYRGFQSGLSADQAYEMIPNVHVYAKAWGPWDVECGCALEQQRQMAIGGAYFDPQIVKADKRGRRISWMVDAGPPTQPGS